MASPITWRNVDGPDLTGAARILGQAQQSMNGAFDAFGRPLQQMETSVDNTWKAMSNYNTDQFLSRLQQFQTPEELAAAQAGGELQRLRDGFGSQINTTQVRDAMAALPQKLQQAFTQNQAYVDTKAELGERPTVGQASQLIANGNFKGAKEFVASQTGLRDTVKAKLLGEVLAAERAQTLFDNGQEDQVFQRNKDKRDAALTSAQIANMGAQSRLLRAQASAASGNGSLASLKDLQSELEIANKGPNMTLSNSVFSGELWDSAKGRESLGKLLKDTGVSWTNMGTSEVNFVENLVDKLVKDGVVSPDRRSILVGGQGNSTKVPLTAGILYNAIAQDDGVFDPSLSGSSGFVKNFAEDSDILTKALEFRGAKEQIAKNTAALQEKAAKGYAKTGRRN